MKTPFVLAGIALALSCALGCTVVLTFPGFPSLAECQEYGFEVLHRWWWIPLIVAPVGFLTPTGDVASKALIGFTIGVWIASIVMLINTFIHFGWVYVLATGAGFAASLTVSFVLGLLIHRRYGAIETW